MAEMQAQMQIFMQAILNNTQNLMTGQVSIKQELTTNFTDIKIEQDKQGQTLEQHSKQLSIHEQAINAIEQQTAKLKSKIKSQLQSTQKDKAAMEQQLNGIVQKMAKLATKDDVDAITVELTKLMSEAKITKGRLSDLEEDIDSLVERQNKTDERLTKLEEFQAVHSAMRNQVSHDSKLQNKDKDIIYKRLDDIANKVESLANKDDVAEVIKQMTGFMSEAKITKGRLADLEDDVDSLLSKNEEVVTVNMLSNIVYNNALLNHPYLMNAALKYYSFDQIVANSDNLAPQLISEAIATGDSELILAGLLSLGGGI